MDIITKLDEFIGFTAGIVAGRMGRGGGSSSGVATGRLKELFLEVVYSKEKDHMKAVDLVIKQKGLDKKWAKKLRKHVKKSNLGKK